jgi:hypothetical protein
VNGGYTRAIGCTQLGSNRAVLLFGQGHVQTETLVDDPLTLEDWTTLAKARDRAKRGLPANMSADQADKFSRRGFIARSPPGRGGLIVTDAGKLAVTNWERSRR